VQVINRKMNLYALRHTTQTGFILMNRIQGLPTFDFAENGGCVDVSRERS